MKTEIERLREDNSAMSFELQQKEDEISHLENDIDNLKQDLSDDTYQLPIENQNDELKIQVLKEHWNKITLEDIDKLIAGL